MDVVSGALAESFVSVSTRRIYAEGRLQWGKKFICFLETLVTAAKAGDYTEVLSIVSTMELEINEYKKATGSVPPVSFWIFDVIKCSRRSAVAGNLDEIVRISWAHLENEQKRLSTVRA